MPSIKGTYTGECKKGKAEGSGKSTGTDIYEGEFKGGQPHGKGKYSWANGNWFDGEWVKGQKNGKGTMVYKNSLGKDSVLAGYWKKDEYTGLYEKPYIIHSRTVHITNVALKFVNKTRDQIDMFIDSETGNRPTSISPSVSNPVNPKPEITNIELVTGNFMKRVDNNQYTKKIGYTFEDVTFPFRAILTIGNNDTIEFSILEAGKWTVDIRTSY